MFLLTSGIAFLSKFCRYPRSYIFFAIQSVTTKMLAAGGVALGEGRLELGEELVVVVDVLGVFDREARLLLEVRDRLLVDVGGPVGDQEVPARLTPTRVRGLGRALEPAGAEVAATGGERRAGEQPEQRAEDACDRREGSPQALASWRCMPIAWWSAVARSVPDSRTRWMCSGVQERLTLAPGSGQRLALALVGVGAEHGHARAVAELDDHLRRRAEVDRAGDDAVDALAAIAERAGAVGGGDVQLFRPDDRVAALARREPVRVALDGDARLELDGRRGRRCSERTVPGIRLETPMKPATNVVVGRS